MALDRGLLFVQFRASATSRGHGTNVFPPGPGAPTAISSGGERPGRSLWRATGSEEAFPNQFEALAASYSAARRPCLHGQGGSQMRNAPSDRYSRSCCCTSAHPSASSPTVHHLCVPGRRPAPGRHEDLWLGVRRISPTSFRAHVLHSIHGARV
ncbi:hypothetical protein MRX96_019603 [Rhipicephalus microplus]